MSGREYSFAGCRRSASVSVRGTAAVPTLAAAQAATAGTITAMTVLFTTPTSDLSLVVTVKSYVTGMSDSSEPSRDTERAGQNSHRKRLVKLCRCRWLNAQAWTHWDKPGRAPESRCGSALLWGEGAHAPAFQDYVVLARLSMPSVHSPSLPEVEGITTPR